ncbi:MAG: universal stress protein [Flammeovirgaceae bacterium]
MKKFERIIVALDNTIFDEKLLTYFSHFTDIIFPKKVYFTYVDRDLEIPSDMTISYKDESGNSIPKDELLKKVIDQRIKEFYFQHINVDFEVKILEGKPLDELLHWAKVKKADLMVLGNKRFSEGSGVVAKRVARNTDCAVLFIPETSKENIKKILVPVDFSTNSEEAMRGAIQLAKYLDNADITAFNVFDVPMSGYPMINMSYEKFVRNMAAFKKEAFEAYLDKFDHGSVKIEADYVENEHNNVAKYINDYAHKNQFDLIVMGAKGHGVIDRILMGSVTEKLVSYEKEIPLLILRNQK